MAHADHCTPYLRLYLDIATKSPVLTWCTGQVCAAVSRAFRYHEVIEPLGILSTNWSYVLKHHALRLDSWWYRSTGPVSHTDI